MGGLAWFLTSTVNYKAFHKVKYRESGLHQKPIPNPSVGLRDCTSARSGVVFTRGLRAAAMRQCAWVEEGGIIAHMAYAIKGLFYSLIAFLSELPRRSVLGYFCPCYISLFWRI